LAKARGERHRGTRVFDNDQSAAAVRQYAGECPWTTLTHLSEPTLNQGIQDQMGHEPEGSP